MTIRATGRYPTLNHAIEQAREADILVLAEWLGSKLKRAGAGEYVGPCPVCGGKDRFGVNIKNKSGTVEAAARAATPSASRNTPEAQHSPKPSRRSPPRR